MKDKLLCPFCQQEMIAHPFIDNIGVAAFECKNKKCVNYKKLVPANIIELLDRTRKALDVAVDALNTIKGKHDPRCAVYHIDKKTAYDALEQITALEQKE